MTRRIFGTTLSLLLAGVALADDPPPPPTPASRIPAPVKEIWDAADSWTLLSLAPEQKPAVQPAERSVKKNKKKKRAVRNGEPPFHGVVVLGKHTYKKDEEIGVKLKDALFGAIEKNANPARCFIPHHGIQVKSGEKTLDLVICFTCHYIDVFVDGEKLGQRLTLAPDPMALFDQALTDAQVPMSKRAK
jgi:hypothetical protein